MEEGNGRKGGERRKDIFLWSLRSLAAVSVGTKQMALDLHTLFIAVLISILCYLLCLCPTLAS